jgi:hypothetical protein
LTGDDENGGTKTEECGKLAINRSVFRPICNVFIFVAIEREGVWKKNHRPVIIQKKIPRTGVPKFIERNKKKRKRQEEQFALFVANAAMIRADAQEKKNGGEAGTSREKARNGSTGSSSPRS